MNNSASQAPQIDEVLGQAPGAVAQQELGVLRQAIVRALDRKRRLGQYAVVWQGAQVRRLPPEALPTVPTDASSTDVPPMPTPLARVVAAWERLPDRFDEPDDPAPLAPVKL